MIRIACIRNRPTMLWVALIGKVTRIVLIIKIIRMAVISKVHD